MKVLQINPTPNQKKIKPRKIKKVKKLTRLTKVNLNKKLVGGKQV
jgi:hypothetical protein